MSEMTAAKAAELIDDATNAWEDVLDEDCCQDDVNRVEELLDLAAESMERADWTGAWLWAGNALGYIRERLAPPPATV